MNTFPQPVALEIQMNPQAVATPFWKQPAFYITLLFVPLIYVVVIMVLWPGSNFTSELRAVVVTAVVSTLLGAIIGFWLATSQSSGKKDDQIAALTAAAINSPPAPSAPLKVDATTKDAKP